MLDEQTLLRAQLEGLLAQESRIKEAIAATRAKLGEPIVYSTGNPSDPLPDIPVIRSGRKPISEEARQRIAAAQKKRWAELKKKQRAAAKN